MAGRLRWRTWLKPCVRRDLRPRTVLAAPMPAPTPLWRWPPAPDWPCVAMSR